MCSAIFFRLIESGRISTRDPGSESRVPSAESRSPSPDIVQHVVLGHAAALARPAYLRQVYVVFSSDASHERGDELPSLVALRPVCGHGLGRCAGGFNHSRGRRRRYRFSDGYIRRATNRGHDAMDRHRLAFLGRDLGQDAGCRRRNFGVNLVGGNLEQRLVALDELTGLLEPADDGPFGDRLPHLGHQDGRWHVRSGQSEPFHLIRSITLDIACVDTGTRHTEALRHREPLVIASVSRRLCVSRSSTQVKSEEVCV